MLNEVGITRSDAGLDRACAALDELDSEWRDADGIDIESVTLRNRIAVARLVAHPARMRRETRGVHYNEDHPERDDEHWQHDTLLRAGR